MKSHFLLVVFLTLPSVFLSQNRLSTPEIKWSLLHPFAAVKVKLITRDLQPMYDSLAQRGIPDQYGSGGKLDAFRHVFFMSAYAQKINATKLEKLGVAHEAGNRQNYLKHQLEDGEFADSISCEMDLMNNLTGIEIGKKK